jgi:hypothetical protein
MSAGDSMNRETVKPRHYLLLAFIFAVILCAGCAARGLSYDACEPYCDVNPEGGYIEACGSLPGAMGDDC